MADVLSRNKKLAFTGAFCALVIVLGITKLGVIPIGSVASVAWLQTLVILATMIAGLPSGLCVGASFGLISLILAAMSPSGILDPLFVNPLCSVLPRMLVAVVAWGVCKLLSFVPKMPKIVTAGITGFIGTVAHTMLVIGCIYIFKGADVREAMGGLGYWALIGALSFNAVLEAITCTIICVAVYLGVFISSKKKSKLSKELDDETESEATAETKSE